MKLPRIPVTLLMLGALLFGTGCSMNRLAVRAISDALAGGGGANAFEQDDDPALVEDALPFALKLYDTLLMQDPDNAELLLAAGSGYIGYANLFLQSKAETLTSEHYEEKERLNERAQDLYLRGRDRVLHALEVRYPGFRQTLTSGDHDRALDPTNMEDVPCLYWAAAGWMGAYSTEPMNLELGMSIQHAAAMMARAFELEPDFDEGAIHEFYISYYASLPEGLGGSREKARSHFERAVEIAGDKKASPYVAFATAVMIPSQNRSRFVELMNRALEIDADEYPRYRLLNTVNQRKARWYLDHLDNFFISAGSPEE